MFSYLYTHTIKRVFSIDCNRTKRSKITKQQISFAQIDPKNTLYSYKTHTLTTSSESLRTEKKFLFCCVFCEESDKAISSRKKMVFCLSTWMFVYKWYVILLVRGSIERKNSINKINAMICFAIFYFAKMTALRFFFCLSHALILSNIFKLFI